MESASNVDLLRETLNALRSGGTILYPTDTVWGLGCDATNPEAVAKIYAIKHRSDSKSLVLLASDVDMVARYVKKIPEMAIDLIEVNDKPMTIIYPGAIASKTPVEGEKPVCDKHFLAYNVVAEDGSVGIRVPAMEFCEALISKFGRPIVSTSANISGEPTPQTFADIPDSIKSAVDFIVDPSLEIGSTGLASQIIKLELNGVVKVIRE
ncbi:MAG: L-threonylcarbamoyladenylate synthase [Bacteroidales bacterium]